MLPHLNPHRTPKYSSTHMLNYGLTMYCVVLGVGSNCELLHPRVISHLRVMYRTRVMLHYTGHPHCKGNSFLLTSEDTPTRRESHLLSHITPRICLPFETMFAPSFSA